MKRIKIGFLAIVALFAMSFTIADQTGALKKLNTKQAIACYTSATAATSGGAIQTLVQGTNNCNLTATFTCAKNLGTTILKSQCTGSNKFCCLEVDTAVPCIFPDGTTGNTVVNSGKMYCQP